VLTKLLERAPRRHCDERRHVAEPATDLLKRSALTIWLGRGQDHWDRVVAQGDHRRWPTIARDTAVKELLAGRGAPSSSPPRGANVRQRRTEVVGELAKIVSA
jgi:hypothetical protein